MSPALKNPRSGARRAHVARKTKETNIVIHLKLDGTGKTDIITPVPLVSHWLDALARHALFDLILHAEQFVEDDFHHVVEDTGLALGQALRQAWGDRSGIVRFGAIALPMDEARVEAAIDLSGRPYLVYDMELPNRKFHFDPLLIEEFMKGLVNEAKFNLHLRKAAGRNIHHIFEASFKALGRCFRQALTRDPREAGVPSTKGTLSR
jgi:imidazoleglycerol-phosphate dehydratase